MAKDFFDVQAALLYQQPPPMPPITIDMLFKWFSAWAKDMGLPEEFRLLKGATTSDTLAIAGYGCHAFVSINRGPRNVEEFALPLKAPILRHKDFDFRAAIRNHKEAIVITVGDGETPIPESGRELMAQAGVMRPVDPFFKITLLQLLMQSVAAVTKPSMISFCPSQSLLTPDEYEAVSELRLPIPILFHPFPFTKNKDTNRCPQHAMAAINASMLIGAELELEAIPDDMLIKERVDLLASIIAQCRKGTLKLEDGDELEQPDGSIQWVRHEATTNADCPLRIIVSFDPSTAEACAKKKPKTSDGHRAFQDRVAKLKSKSMRGEMARPLDGLSAPVTPAALSGTESAEQLRARVRDTMAPTGGVSPRTGLMNGPVKLVVATALLIAFVFFGPSQELSNMVTKDTAIVEGVKTLLVSPELATSTTATSETSGKVRTIGQSSREVLRP